MNTQTAPTSRRFTVVSLSRVQDEYFRLHREGCSDLAKEIGVSSTVEAINAQHAARAYIDEELAEMGYSERDVKIVGCAR